MKMHRSVVEKLMYLFDTYGGHDKDLKLKKALADLDLTIYERKEQNNGEIILVLTEDYLKKLAGH